VARRDYLGDGIVVHWDSELCEHSANCVRGLPAVFDTERKPWIDVSGASADDIASAVDRCPSRALTYSRTDGGPLGPNGVTAAPEGAVRVASAAAAEDGVKTVTPRLNGPLVVTGTITLTAPDGATTEHTGRTFLCRCGGSSDKPLCDGTHKRNGFQAPGIEPPRKPNRP
jgi:uncharacterized Fe-S cluster protein YjdI/CDGSH-type Zn-finger protein